MKYHLEVFDFDGSTDVAILDEEDKIIYIVSLTIDEAIELKEGLEDAIERLKV